MASSPSECSSSSGCSCSSFLSECSSSSGCSCSSSPPCWRFSNEVVRYWHKMLSKDDRPALDIVEAARLGDIPKMRKLAKRLERKGKSVEKVMAALNYPMLNILGPLHIAAWCGRQEMCKFLIKNLHIDVNASRDNGAPPLIFVMYHAGRIETVRLLLDHGANPNITDSMGYTALHTAASLKGCYEIAELLLSRGADVDPMFEKGTPLHIAAKSGNVRMLDLLLRNKANPNRVVDLFYTPLTLAIFAPSLKCVQLLIKAGADVNAGRPVTPLVIAATDGLIDFIECLLEAGADVNIPDEIGRMPVEIAAIQGWRECVEILFPLTSRVDRFADWSIDGIIQHVGFRSSTDPHLHQSDESTLKVQGEAAFQASALLTKDPNLHQSVVSTLKAQGDAAFQKKDYTHALALYTKAMETHPNDSTLYAKRSLCWLHMGEKDKALDDANTYKGMGLDLSNSCDEQGAVLILMKEYGSACEALLSGLEMDFGSDPIGLVPREVHECFNPYMSTIR